MRMISDQAPISRTDIAERTGLAPSTITNIVTDLQNRNLVRVCGRASSNGGRPPILLEINPNGGYFISVELNAPKSEISVLDLTTNLVSWLRFDTVMDSVEATFGQLVSHIQEAVDWCGVTAKPVLGVGISVTGLVDTLTGTVIESTNLAWEDFPLLERLKATIDYQILVENEANAATFGEYVRAVKIFDMKNVMYLAVGSGIGCGIIINGSLYTGTYGMAGEIGHITIDPDGPLCRCGKSGCLEVFASAQAISGAYAKWVGLKGGLAALDVISRAETGDAAAIQIIKSSAKHIGTAIGNQVNILNLDTVILGGELLTSESLFFTGIKEGAQASIIRPLSDGVSIRVSLLKSHAAVVGAATLLWHKIFA